MIIFSAMERATATWKPNVEVSPTCPRCGSMNTKFCYYNNYSLTQPRYFCKGCRRYWTKGGSLRNVPVGGGCRKTRRAKSSSNSIRVVSTDSNHRRGGAVFIGGQQGISAADNDNNPGGSTTSPAVDLAAVYANFMNQKPQPQPQPGHIPETTLANNNDGAGAGPSFEFSGYPAAMLNVDYFVPEAAMAPQDGGFVFVDEFGNNNNSAAAMFQEQFCGGSLPPILPPPEELTTSEGWPDHNSDMNMNMNMMFPLNTISAHHEPEVQGCPNHHITSSSSASLFSIPTYDSIFRP